MNAWQSLRKEFMKNQDGQEIVIAPPTPVTAHDKLAWAYGEVNKAIAGTDGGRKCDGPTWASLQACRRHIREAMQMLRDDVASCKSETGVLWNKATGDYWCGQFGWMPLPNSRVLRLTREEADIRITNEVCLGGRASDYVFHVPGGD